MSTATDTETIADLRHEMDTVRAQIRRPESRATLLSYDYTGPDGYVPAVRGVFGREITPARTVKAGGPSIGDMIAFRWEALRWLVREINIHRGLYDSH